MVVVVVGFVEVQGGVTRADFDRVEATVRDVWAGEPSKLFTPDDLRGNYTSLARAVVECGWPDVAETAPSLRRVACSRAPVTASAN